MAQRNMLPSRETEGARITLEGGVIIIEAKEHAVVDLAEAERQSAAVAELVSRPVPFLIAFGKTRAHTKEARDFFSRDPEHVSRYTACALVVNNPLAKVFANFFLGINRLPKPTRIFTSRERALEWLAGFR